MEEFTFFQSRWEHTILTPLLRPGLYFLRITALSKTAHPAQLNLRLEHIHGEWTIGEGDQSSTPTTFRMSVLELCKEAAKQHGWRIFNSGSKDLTAIHFAKSIAQGASDARFKVWGSECGNYDVLTASRINRLVIIPASVFERLWIDLPPALDANDNRQVAAFDPDRLTPNKLSFKKIYANLHVERRPALEWLTQDAPSLLKLYRGEPT